MSKDRGRSKADRIREIWKLNNKHRISFAWFRLCRQTLPKKKKNACQAWFVNIQNVFIMISNRRPFVKRISWCSRHLRATLASRIYQSFRLRAPIWVVCMFLFAVSHDTNIDLIAPSTNSFFRKAYACAEEAVSSQDRNRGRSCVGRTGHRDCQDFETTRQRLSRLWDS